MNVQHKKDMPEKGHSIEIGHSTWDPEGERSIRDRWDQNGKFSHVSSSEIPMASMLPLVSFAAEHDELSVDECVSIATALLASVQRQTS